MRRRAIFQRLEEEAEARSRFFIGHTHRVEDLLLNILPVNTNGSRTQLSSIEYDVISQRAHGSRIRQQAAKILLVGRRKRMMRRVPARLFLVVFEHWEIRYPQEVEVRGATRFMEGAMLLLVFLCQAESQCSGGH